MCMNLMKRFCNNFDTSISTTIPKNGHTLYIIIALNLMAKHYTITILSMVL